MALKPQYPVIDASQINTEQDLIEIYSVKSGEPKLVHPSALGEAIPTGSLKIDGDTIDGTLRYVVDKDGTQSPLKLSTNRLGIDADPTATTQAVAVIESLTTNAGIVLKPNGTGAIMAQVPDGTATGGNARGTNAVDLQTSRTSADQVASRPNSVIVGGYENKITGSDFQGAIVGGGANVVSSRRGFVGGGYGNNNSGWHGSIVGGQENTLSGTHGSIIGGIQNNVSSSYGVVSGGQSNTASTNTHATIVGGYQNTASGQYSVAGGYSSVASAIGNISLGYDNTASGNYAAAIGSFATASSQNAIAFGIAVIASGQQSICIGESNGASGLKSATIGTDCQANQTGAFAIGPNNRAQGEYSLSNGWRSEAYLYGQKTFSSGIFGVGTYGDAQESILIARKSDTLSSGGNTTLSLDGTGTTNLIVPGGANRAWNVTVKWVAVCTATGSGTTAVGDVAIATDSFMFKKVSGTSSIGTVQNLQNSQDATMAGATCSYAVGGSQDLQITFTAPASANATTFRVVAKVELTEVAW